MIGLSRWTETKLGAAGRPFYTGAAIMGLGLLAQVSMAAPSHADGLAGLIVNAAAAGTGYGTVVQAHDEKKSKRKKKIRRGSFFSG